MKTTKKIKKYTKEKYSSFTPEEKKLSDENERTIAYDLAQNGENIFTDEEMKLADKYGKSVAHIMAEKGYVAFTEEQMRIADNDGKTVAHVVAENNHTAFINKKVETTNNNNWRPITLLLSIGMLLLLWYIMMVIQYLM